MKFDWPTSPAIRSSELWKSHEWVRKVNANLIIDINQVAAIVQN